jgi:uncharacterized OB-fold protein
MWSSFTQCPESLRLIIVHVKGNAVPVVGYLSLEGSAHLVGQECAGCGAIFLDRRSGCARCSGEVFHARPLSPDGVLRAFTIVHRAPPAVETPFAVGIVDLDGGGTVKANLVGVAASPEGLRSGTAVRFTTFVAGHRADGAEVVSFGYAPA